MKTVILVRHATAVKRCPEKDDFHRSLKKCGRKEAREMASRLEALKSRPKLLISSPANRALETAAIFAKALARPMKKIQECEELYGDLSPQGFLDLIRGLDDKHDAAAFFGHDPLFSEFAQFIAPGFYQDMPKAGVLGVESDTDSWKDVNPDSTKMAFFFYPGDTAVGKKRRKDLRKELETRIEEAVSEVIDEFEIPADGKTTKELGKTSAKLAKKLASRVKKGNPPSPPSVTAGQDEEEQG